MLEAARQILSEWKSVESGPFFELEPRSVGHIESAVGADMLRLLQEFGGREGFLGQAYLRLYRVEELMSLAFAYELPEFFNGILIFGSDGGGEAYAFPIWQPGLDQELSVIRVPFIPLVKEHADIVAPDFSTFLRVLSESGPSPEIEMDAVGLVTHHKHPIIFGGDPTDPENIVMAPHAKHAEVACYWNKVYFQHQSSSTGEA